MIKWIALIWILGCSQSVFAQSPHWNEIQTPVKASLRGLSPVSGQVCWASGSGGTWLLTLDGGKTWKSGVIAGLDTVDFRSIHAFDANTAVVASAGQPAVIFRTTDGGNSWQKVHQEGGEAFFDAISFNGKKKGYVLGDPVGGNWMVLETNDGGQSWKMMHPLPQPIQGEAAFAASSSSMIAGKKSLSFATGGPKSRLHDYPYKEQIWTVRELPLMAQGESSEGVFAMTSVKDHTIVVGGDYTKLDLKDGNSLIIGDGPDRIPSGIPFGYRSGVSFWKKENLTIAVGPSGSDFSRDQGETWKNFSSIGYHAVKVSLDGKSIWASGSQGRIGQLEK